MSDPKHHEGMQVDPSEGSIDEREEQQSFRADAAEREDSAMLEVDPSEGPTE